MYEKYINDTSWCGRGFTAVVIGAGINGLLTAWRLLEDGWKVILLEAKHVGAGSSSRSAACIRQQFSTPATVQAMVHCTRFYESFGSRFGTTEKALHQVGYFYPYWEDNAAAFEAARQRVAMQQTAGLHDVVLWDDPATVLREFPFIEPEGLIGAHFCPTDGFCFPSTIMSVVFGYCLRETQPGGRFAGRFEPHMNAPVTGASLRGDRIMSLTTPSGVFGGDIFINCTNAWTTQLQRMIFGEEDVRSRLPVAPLRRFLWFFPEFRGLLTAAYPEFDPRKFPMVVLPSGVYARPEGKNAEQLMMGHAHSPEPEWNFTHEDQDGPRPESDELGFAAWALLAERLPFMEVRGFNVTTTGFYGATPDHNPIIGRDVCVCENLFHNAAHSGRGVMFAPAAAEATAARVRGQSSFQTVAGEVGLAPFQANRPFDSYEVMVL